MHNTEIGSEFWDIPVCERGTYMFPSHTQWYVSGRCALEAIILDLQKRSKISSVCLPSWCCDSMIYPFFKHGIKVNFYSITIENDTIKCNLGSAISSDVLFLMNYFGYHRDYLFPKFDGIIIQDLTHSIFTRKTYDADYYFGSLRKWFGVFTGGFAWKKNESLLPEFSATAESEKFVKFRRMAMEFKSKYIAGTIDSKQYLSIFSDAEKILNSGLCAPANAKDVELIKHVNFPQIHKSRRDNAQILINDLSQYTIFKEIQKYDCPLFVPIKLPHQKRDALKQYLIKLGIYCPIHWPQSAYHQISPNDQQIYDTELSLICDQRYNINDIKRESNIILEFLNVENHK